MSLDTYGFEVRNRDPSILPVQNNLLPKYWDNINLLICLCLPCIRAYRFDSWEENTGTLFRRGIELITPTTAKA